MPKGIRVFSPSAAKRFLLPLYVGIGRSEEGDALFYQCLGAVFGTNLATR